MTLGGICVPPTVNYLQYLVTGSTLTAVGPFQLTVHSLELSRGFYPGPDHQCRLFQTVCLKRIYSLGTSAFSALEVLDDNCATYLLTHCVSKKRRPFYFCESLAKYYPISIIFGSSIVHTPGNLQQKYACLPTTPVYCADTIPCKNYDLLTCVCIVLKSDPFTVCNKFARCHPNLIIFSKHMPEEFCNEIFTSLSPPNLTLRVVTVPCKASKNLRACQSRSAC